MFYFRINKLKILDNRTSGFLFFKKDMANVKIISFITTDNMDLPDLGEWVTEKDPAKKRILLTAAVTNLLAARILTPIMHVKDQQTIFFGDTGYVLFESETIPKDFNWCFVAVKSNLDDRELGQLLTGVVADPEFDSFAGNLATFVLGAANPVFCAGVAVAKFATGVISKILANHGDDQVGLLYMSLDREEHYKHGIRNSDDVPDLTGNLLIDYSIFAFEPPQSHRTRKVETERDRGR